MWWITYCAACVRGWSCGAGEFLSWCLWCQAPLPADKSDMVSKPLNEWPNTHVNVLPDLFFCFDMTHWYYHRHPPAQDPWWHLVFCQERQWGNQANEIIVQKLEIRFACNAFAGSIALWGRSKLAESTDFARLVMERCEEQPPIEADEHDIEAHVFVSPVCMKPMRSINVSWIMNTCFFIHPFDEVFSIFLVFLGFVSWLWHLALSLSGCAAGKVQI